MSLENLHNEGNGSLEFRLKIMGCPYEWVTCDAMVQDLVDIKRRNGLLHEGLRVTERVNLADSGLKIRPHNFTIVDIEGEATKAFFRQPTYETELSLNLLSGATNGLVADASGIAAGDIIHIGQEAIKVGALIDNQIVDLTRGYWGSIETSHFVLPDDGVNGSIPVKVLKVDNPTLERRRFILYAYGEGDDLQGDGTIWSRGIILTEPKNSGPEWTFEGGGPTEALKYEMAGKFGEVNIRGIWIEPQAPFRIRFGLSADDFWRSTASDEFTIDVYGFFEDRQAFLDAINAEITSNLPVGWTESIPSAVLDGGKLGFTFATDATPKYVMVAQDLGQILQIPAHQNGGTAADFPSLKKDRFLYYLESGVWHATTGEALASKTMAHFMEEPLPEKFVFNMQSGFRATAENRNRIYLDVPVLPDNETYRVRLVNDEAGEGTYELSVNAVDYDERFLEISARLTGLGVGIGFGGSSLPIDFVIVDGGEVYLELSVIYQENGSIVDFLETVANEAPSKSGTGLWPSFYHFDFDAVDAQNSWNISDPFLADRNYVRTGEDSVSLESWVLPELTLGSYMLATTAEGKLTVRPFELATATELNLSSAVGSNTLDDERFPVLEPNAHGIFNVMSVQTGLNPATDEYEGQTINVRYLDSIALFGREKSLKPELKSSEGIGVSITHDSLASLVKTIKLLGQPYYIISFDVPYTFANLRIGDYVQITHHLLPNAITGERGASYTGQIIGRDFSSDGFGALEIWSTLGNFAGYSPSAQVVTKSNVGGSSYQITVSASAGYARSGVDDIEYFNVGDMVDFVEFDTWTPKICSGSITTITDAGATYTIDCDISAPFNGFLTASARMEYPLSGTVGIQSSQYSYCYIASGSINASGEEYPEAIAKIFGP